jgi:N-acyl-D-aspartate/D-glutamate deacylase
MMFTLSLFSSDLDRRRRADRRGVAIAVEHAALRVPMRMRSRIGLRATLLAIGMRMGLRGWRDYNR